MSSKRILLIDDDQNITAVVSACLVTLGAWSVFIASSGRQGLIKAKEEQPDAILLDVMMPDMNGVTLLKKLRQESLCYKMPVILLTAKAQLRDHHSYGDLDVAGVISKPFDPLTLVAQISQLLGWEQR